MLLPRGEIADGLLAARGCVGGGNQVARRPARGLSSPLGSMAGLTPTMAEQQRCVLHQHFRKLRKLQLAKSRALFEYTWVPGKTSDGRAVPPAPSVATSGRSGLCPKPRSPTPPDPRRARKPTSGAVVPLNRVRTGGGRGASVPRPPGAGVPGWFGPGRRLGPPVARARVGPTAVGAVFRWCLHAVFSCSANAPAIASGIPAATSC